MGWVPFESLKWCIQYHILLHLVLTAPDCIVSFYNGRVCHCNSNPLFNSIHHLVLQGLIISFSLVITSQENPTWIIGLLWGHPLQMTSYAWLWWWLCWYSVNEFHAHQKETKCVTRWPKPRAGLAGFIWQDWGKECGQYHYNDVMMGSMASQITSLTIVYSVAYSGADQRKHQSSVSVAFVRGLLRGPVNSPHKWPVTRKMFPFDDVIMCNDPLSYTT